MVFIDACRRERTPYTPVWFMRQAGRYLVEYKEVRARALSFIELACSPELACEVSLQPIDILDVDACILFSDILMLPHEMGLGLAFEPGVGPRFARTIKDMEGLNALLPNAASRLGYVYDTISLIKRQLPSSKALIGFSGAPFTLATYMIEGSGSKSYAATKRLLYTDAALMHALLGRLRDEVIEYARGQIRAGVNAFMLFDSWANALEAPAYREFGFSYIQQICTTLKKEYPSVPLIIFPRCASGLLGYLEGDFDVVSVAYQSELSTFKDKIGHKYTLQGNLEPARLYNFEAMKQGALEIIELMQNKNHIFNLGHGMMPDLPRENAIELVKLVREASSRY